MFNETQIFPSWGSIYHIDDINDAISAGDLFWKKSIYDRRLLIIRNPAGSTMEQYWQFCANFGRCWSDAQYRRMQERHQSIDVDGETRWLGLFSNKISRRLGDRGMVWHADNPDVGLPMRSLKMVQCPNPENGLTGFLNVELAWANLPHEIRQPWYGRMVEQQSWYTPGTDFEIYPAIKRHPITGVESPRANDWCVSGTSRNDRWINDVLDEKGGRIGGQAMGDLIGEMEKIKDAIWYHKWMENDIAIYDNHGFVHNRTSLNLQPDEERILWRINIDHDQEFAKHYQC